MSLAYPRLLPAGDTGLLVELGETVEEAVNLRVLALDRALAAARIAGVVETVPTYRSLLILYEPLALGHAALVREVETLLARLPERADAAPGRRWRLPLVYGGEFGVDCAATAAALGIGEAVLAAGHAAVEYRVFMIGFQPGFAYLGSVDPALAISRRDEPRQRVPAGSVSIAGRQCVINSVTAPSGWNLIARTPVRLFMPERNPAFLLAAGDKVQFVPVPPEAWDALDRRAAAGELVAEPL